MAAEDASSPGRSRRASAGSLDSGTQAQVAASATRATGTSATKTDGQPKRVSSRPPITGPTATPSPVTAPHRPTAFARSRRSGKALVMIDRVVGKMVAAQAPMANRMTISASGDPATPPSALVAANPARPNSRAGRRPKRSPSEPAVSTSAAKARL
ncbi:hypothetical protein GCM10025734_08550 [Kitasatospora paranensis]